MKKLFFIIFTIILNYIIIINASQISDKNNTELYSLSNEDKIQDLNEFCNILEKNQKHLYHVVSKETFNNTKKEIEDNISNLSDVGFYYELQRLAALSHDAHTFVNSSPDINIEKHFIPIQIEKIDNKWFLTASFGQNYREYLSNELIEINGHSIKDILKLAKPYISYENNIRLENRFTQKINHADFLYHLGVIDNMNNITFTVRNNKGKTIKFDVSTCSWDILVKGEYFSIYKAPKTKPDSNRIYDFFDLNSDTLFIRYNSAMEDPNYPLDEFTKELKEKIESKRYSKLIVDLRDNAGGDYSLFPPTIEMIKTLKDKQNFKLYTLISDNTFSSGVVHAAQLQHDAQAILVGTPTSGNVYGYGDTDGAELFNSHIDIIYSTKFKELVQGYKEDALYPDIHIKHTITDYMSGIDRDIETILNGAEIYF